MKKEIKSFEYNPVTVGLVIGGIMLAYAILPVDFIPDVIAGLGQLDDALVLTVGTIAEVVNLVNGISYSKKEKPVKAYASNASETKAEYTYAENVEDADFEEI